MQGNILHTGDMQLHKPCHLLNQQMQVPVLSSWEREAVVKILAMIQVQHQIISGRKQLKEKKLSILYVNKLINTACTQNSAKCRDVCEFSALNVGPKVYTWERVNTYQIYKKHV